MNMGFTPGHTITLPDFIRDQEELHVGATGRLTDVLLSIALGTKIVSRGVNRAGLASLLGLAGGYNVHGEEVQKLDVFADDVFCNTVGRTGEFFSMVSEEQESLFQAAAAHEKSRYVIAFDPLDGSSNIDVNVAIGSIWGIYRRKSAGALSDPSDHSDFYQPGRSQVAAGYTIYGSSTMFVYSTGEGVNGFTLDPTIGEFILTHPAMRMPASGAMYSCNEGSYTRWSRGVRAYIDQLREPVNGAPPLRGRYVGSLVADFHRTLLKGGIFLYPASDRYPNGKLRLLYECAPLAFIAEQTGGRASDGRLAILDKTPTDIHQRSPFFIGSPTMMQELEGLIKELD